MNFKRCPINPILLFVILLATFFSGLPASADLPQIGRPGEGTTPETVLKGYLEALYSRDHSRVYALVSTLDKEWKNQEEYLNENTPFVGRELDLARKLATLIVYENTTTKTQGNRATVKTTFRMPNANDSALRRLLRDFDSERLAKLSGVEFDAIKARLDKMHRTGKLPTIKGEEQWELIKEPQGWRIFLNWAGAIQVLFTAEVKDDLPVRFWPVRETVLALPGETYKASYRIKNLTDKPVTAKAIHMDEPKELAEKYLQIIQCFCFLQINLEPGEEAELPLVFRVQWNAPETIKNFSVRYVFYPLETYPEQDSAGTARQLAALGLGQLEVRLKDHREAIGDFSRLDLRVSQIRIKSERRPKKGVWKNFVPSTLQVDLTRLVEGRYVVVLKENIAVGEYRWIKVDLVGAKGVLKNGKQKPIKIQDNPVALKFPITAGQTTVVTVDLVVLDMSDHPGQEAKYELHIKKVSEQVKKSPGS